MSKQNIIDLENGRSGGGAQEEGDTPLLLIKIKARWVERGEWDPRGGERTRTGIDTDFTG